MEKEKNMIITVNYYMKENIYLKENGTEKDLMNMVILYMN